MFTDLEGFVVIISAMAAAMVSRHFAIRFLKHRHYSPRRQTVVILTPMFAGMFLVLNAFWLSLTWPDLLIVPVVTLLQMALVLPLIIAISFVPNPFLKPTDSEDQISSR